MKTIKVFSALLLMSLCMVSFGQAKPAAAPAAKSNVYYVQLTHTPEQCMKMLDDMKTKGDAYLSKFEFGCMSGDHTAYGFLTGKSEDDVRQMLPKEEQASAKIQKVDKFTSAQIEQLHKSKM
jgi:hypothetical protein